MPPRQYNQIEKAITVLDKSVALNIFNDDRGMLFIFRKTERIVAAVYLVSGHLSDREPLRRELREAATLIGKQVLSFRNQTPHQSRQLSAVRMLAVRLVSLLDLATIADLLSQSSVSLLRQEAQTLISTIESRVIEGTAPTESRSLPRSFFEKTESEKLSKGHQFLKDTVLYEKDTRSPSSVHKDFPITPTDKRQFSRARALYDGRRSKVLALLREMGSATVKDISEVIRDCSLKSIQRILADLARTGILEIMGEKRWTHYKILKQKKAGNLTL